MDATTHKHLAETESRGHNKSRRRLWPESSRVLKRTIAVGLVALAGFAYLAGLSQTMIPTIGDEAIYLQIARVTKQSGHWLPLRWEPGVWNTKPPLLFWQGRLTGDLGGDASLLGYRLPSVIVSFLIALLIGWVVHRARAGLDSALLAGLSYLAFFSTYQHGRPFLMHPEETLFVFLPTALILGLRQTIDWKLATITGFCLGIAALYKSFVLIAVGVIPWAVVALYLQRQRKEKFKPLKIILIYSSLAVLLALGLFSIWFWLDPNPSEIFKQFVMGENLGKMKKGSYLVQMFSGSYPITRIWLGAFANAGLLAGVVLALIVDTVRRRTPLTVIEKGLWIFIFCVLVFYTVPSQRQENYILPAMAALAALIGIGWQRIPKAGFYFGLAVGSVASLAFLFMLLKVPYSIPVAWPWALYAMPAACVLLGLLSVLKPSTAKPALLAVAFSLSSTITLFGAPFSQGFSAETREILKNQEVFFPKNFFAAEEYFQIQLPESFVRGYWDSQPVNELIEKGNWVAVVRDFEPHDSVDPSKFEVAASVPYLRTRLSPEHIRALIFENKFSYLIATLNIERLKPKNHQ